LRCGSPNARKETFRQRQNPKNRKKTSVFWDFFPYELWLLDRGGSGRLAPEADPLGKNNVFGLVCMLRLTSFNNQVSLTTKKRSAQGLARYM